MVLRLEAQGPFCLTGKPMLFLPFFAALTSFFFAQGWFTPGQIFVLDEYCARYGVRSCFRHLRYLEDLLDRSEKNILVDPTLIHFSYAYCASHVHGNR